MNTFTTKSWEESVVSGEEDSPRVAHAHAVMTYSGLLDGEAVCDYLLYYAGPGYDGGGLTSPGLERFEGSVDGRKGSFVLRHEVGFDAKGIQGTWTVLAGSGTGELAGLTGRGTIDDSPGDSVMAYTFEYSFG